MSYNKHSDLTCRAIMAKDYAVLSPEMTLVEAIEALLTNRVFAMPVVDESGKYLGQFRKNLLLSRVLPAGAVNDMRLDRISRMIDAGLLKENMRDLRTNFATIADDLVSAHLDTEAPTLYPDQPLVTVIFYFYKGRNFLPVVERETGMLVGTVSAWDVLEAMMMEND